MEIGSLGRGGEKAIVRHQDSRIRLIEVAEYASLRDHDQRCVNALVDLLVAGLKPA